MRLSVLPHARQPWPDILAVARVAEQAGWDGVWFDDDRPPALECWTVVAGLAAAVPRVRLGAFIADDRGRHPAVVAKVAATVDQLSGGRLVLGLVAAPSGDAIARLEEICQVVTRLVDSNRANWTGRFYQLRDAPLEPKPVQRPLPLALRHEPGAIGDDIARLAARHANQWHTSGHPEQVRDQVAALRACCQEIGRDPDDISVAVQANFPCTIADYADAGVDELILADDALGEGRKKLGALARIMADIAAA